MTAKKIKDFFVFNKRNTLPLPYYNTNAIFDNVFKSL